MSASHITDSRFYRAGYTTDEARRLFCDHRRLQRWLSVEVALAQSQAELGIIPATAAEQLTATADLRQLNCHDIQADIARTGHSLIPLLNAWQRITPDEAGQFIHYGATTQDIQDTAQILEIKDAFLLVRRDLARIAAHLSELASTHQTTVITGRTHGQPALPTTFGLKVAGWLDELLRHHERLTQLQPRLFAAQLFGGVGTMASFGDQGMELLSNFAARLDLVAPACAWHNARDRLVELTSTCALLGGFLGRIANEIYQLARHEIGELAEPFHQGKIGSTTMPHKRNPEICEQVVVLARLIKGNAALAYDTLINEHERDYRAVRLEWVTVTDSLLYLCGALHLTQSILEGLTVHQQRMEHNAGEVGELLASEALMFHLGRRIGKQKSHQLLYDLAMEAIDRRIPFHTLLKQNTIINETMTAEDLEAILNMHRQCGLAHTITQSISQQARTALAAVVGKPAPCPLAGDDGRCLCCREVC